MDQQQDLKVSRRGFLKRSLLVAGACCFPGLALASESSYYLQNSERLLKDCDELLQDVARALAPKLGPERTKRATELAKEFFVELLPKFPDVGGGANRNIANLIQAGELAAIYTGMKSQGCSAKEAGRLYYELCERDCAAQDPAQLRAAGDAYFSPENYAFLRQWAQKTQLRAYPGDWVATVLFGGKDDSFDVGHDYAECGAVKLFRAQNMPEIAPYFCLNDFTFSKFQGMGLARTMTIAQGDLLCNFRYKHGRATTQNWDTETPRFRA